MATRITYRNLDLVHETLTRLDTVGVEDRNSLKAQGILSEDPVTLRLLGLCIAICRQQLSGHRPREGPGDSPLGGDLCARLANVLQEAAQSLASGRPQTRHFATATLHLVERTLRLRPASSSIRQELADLPCAAGLQARERGHRDRNPLAQAGRALRCGTYSTPDFIVNAMVSDVLGEFSRSHAGQKRILDLSLEAGHFALAVATRKGSGMPVTFYGCDRDEQALSVAQRLLAFLLEAETLRGFELRTSCQDSLLEGLPSAWPSSFDAIIGNPPWQPLHVNGPNSIPERFLPYLNARSDVCLAFMLRAHELLSRGGLLSYVIPSGVLFNRNASGVRELLLNHYELLNLRLYPQSSFVEVSCLIPVSFLARKRAAQSKSSYPTKIVHMSVSLGGEGRPRGSRRVRAARAWGQHPDAALHPLARSDCAFLFRVPGEPLAKFGILQAGARLARERRVCPARSFLGVHARAIRSFHACPHGLTTYRHDEPRFDRDFPCALLDRVKIVYPDLRYMTHRRRLVASVAGPGVYPVSTASLFAPADPALAHFFASLFNSSLANAWYKLHDTSRSIKLHYLRSLPLMHDEKKWNSIGEIGRECSRQREYFHLNLSSCSVRNEERVLSERFPRAYARLMALQEALDQEVFDLYGLSGRCRKVVSQLSEARVF